MPPNQTPFPFWLLIHRGESPWRPVLLPSGHAAAFSTHQRAGEFLAREASPRWEVRLVVRPTLAVLMAEFRRQGVMGIILDPADGEGVTFLFTEDS